MSDEQWRPVVGCSAYAGYEVSSLGRLRSYRKHKGSNRPVLRKLTPDKEGYLQAGFIVDGKMVMRKIHHLVLEAFVGLRGEGQVTRHLDGDPGNNQLSNLVWGSQSENMQDQIHHGTATRGVKNSQSKLSEEQVREIRSRLTEGESGSSLAKEFGLSDATICRIRYGHRYRSVE